MVSYTNEYTYTNLLQPFKEKTQRRKILQPLSPIPTSLVHGLH